MDRRRLLPLLVAPPVAAGFIALGLWQVSRLHDRREANRAALAARHQPVINLNRGAAVAGELANRRVTVTGEYDRNHEFVIRQFVYREQPGIQLVTPLRIAGSDSAILVNRGFVPAPDAVTADVSALDEPGTRTVSGLAFPVTSRADSGKPITRYDQESWGGLDLDAVRRRVPYPVMAVVLLQAPDGALPSLPRRLEPPPLDDGPHLSYAIQWFAFAAIALAGAAILAWKTPPPRDAT